VKSRSSRTSFDFLIALLTMLFASSLASGCGPGNVIAKKKTIEEVDDQQATCKVAKDPLNPLIVEWPATSKVALDSASKRGIVVVSYAGCTLKVLNECHAKGDYEYTGVTPARDKIDISSQDDLYARLPLGAVNLKGELDSGSSLKLDYIAVGQRVSKEAPTELEGDGCEGATHYVRTITLGAYALDVQAKAEAGASVGIGNAGGGAKRKEGDQRLRGSGDVDKCAGMSPKTEGAANDSGCGAPLQLDLAPLRSTGGGHVVASSFGEGLHTLSLGPTELSKGESNIAGVASLKDIDPDYLKLFQDALHADRGESVKPQDKANAWAALATYPGQNPKKKLAEERRDEWQKTADDLEKLKTQYLSDKSKLDKIVALDDEVVSKKDKLAYQEQFKQTYEPHEKLLSVALGTNVGVNGGGNQTGDSASASGVGTTDSVAPKETFRLDAEGGWDAQQLKFTPVTSSSTIDTTNTNAGGVAGGFVGAVLTLPTIPVPGAGLSVLTRYTFGAATRLLADAGMRFAMSKGVYGLGFGAYVGYARLMDANVKQPGLNGVDFRLAGNYEFNLGKIVSLGFDASLAYLLVPAAGTDASVKGIKPEMGGGVGFSAGGNVGFHFGGP
jgi:hypothetical protein